MVVESIEVWASSLATIAVVSVAVLLWFFHFRTLNWAAVEPVDLLLLLLIPLSTVAFYVVVAGLMVAAAPGHKAIGLAYVANLLTFYGGILVGAMALANWHEWIAWGALAILAGYTVGSAYHFRNSVALHLGYVPPSSPEDDDASNGGGDSGDDPKSPPRSGKKKPKPQDTPRRTWGIYPFSRPPSKSPKVSPRSRS